MTSRRGRRPLRQLSDISLGEAYFPHMSFATPFLQNPLIFLESAAAALRGKD
jgi:hypothetical protein